MKEQSVFLDYKESRVHLLRFGSGSQLLIAFHGFGDRAELFLSLRKTLEKHYVVCAVDLPYHGRTEWSTPYYTPDDLMAIIQLILEKEEKSVCSLMGFSMGGRLAQKIFSRLEPELDQLFLLAPDGLQSFSLKGMLWVPLSLRKALRSLLRQPGWLLNGCNVLYRWGLLSKFHHHFVKYHLSSEERRERLLNTWVAMNWFDLSPSKVKMQLGQSKVPVALYFGKKDTIIPLALGEKLAEGESNIQLYLLDGGHQMFGSALNDLLEAQMQKAT